MPEQSNTTKVLKGVSTQTFITILIGVIEIVSFSIMSRLLTQEDFGYYASITAINGGVDDDHIYNTGTNVTINGDSGADSIKSEADNVKIFAGDGNDVIIVAITSTYDWDNSYWVDTFYHNATIDGGNGNDIITNYNSNSSINGGNGEDTIYNGVSVTAINGDSDNDFIINGQYFGKGGQKVTINGGDNNDTITSFGSNSMLNGDSGNDLIYNGYYYYEPWNIFYSNNSDDDYNNDDYNGKNTIINSGDGNDTINNRGQSSKIFGGNGNDSIYNYGSNITINAGAGNDTIDIDYNSSSNVIEYSNGDGNDILYGYHSTDKIRITRGDYYIQKSDNDIILKVGSGSITLKNAKDTDLNIEGTLATIWKVNDTTATYGNDKKTLATITGLKTGLKTSNGTINGISLNGSTITLSANVLGDGNVNVSGNYKLALASNVTKPTTGNSEWTVSGTTATYKAGNTTAGYTVASNGKTISYSTAKAGDNLITINGLKSGLKVSNGKINGIS